jgi:hypothetical protein
MIIKQAQRSFARWLKRCTANSIFRFHMKVSNLRSYALCFFVWLLPTVLSAETVKCENAVTNHSGCPIDGPCFEPGQMVDIVQTRKTNEGRRLVDVIAVNVRILTTKPCEAKDPPICKTHTICALPADCSKIELAKLKGDLNFLSKDV